MHDSQGKINLYGPDDKVLKPQFRTRFPTPEHFDTRKILKALEKLSGVREPVAWTDAALAPLTTGERGYVLGILTSLENGRTL